MSHKMIKMKKHLFKLLVMFKSKFMEIGLQVTPGHNPHLKCNQTSLMDKGQKKRLMAMMKLTVMRLIWL